MGNDILVRTKWGAKQPSKLPVVKGGFEPKVSNAPEGVNGPIR